jgi:hypothetical protein
VKVNLYADTDTFEHHSLCESCARDRQRDQQYLEMVDESDHWCEDCGEVTRLTPEQIADARGDLEFDARREGI